jgi:hypothetical protein
MSYCAMHPVPWQARSEWREIKFFFDTIQRVHGPDLEPVGLLARRIRGLVDSLSEPVETLCAVTCPLCKDVCCQRATIWYDFKDMLYVYFGMGIFPDRQIKKLPGQGTPHCANLTPTGCLLPRNLRPFVCTWYFCPDQKTAMAHESLFFSAVIAEIKVLRQEMEDAFCSITAG